MIDWFRELHPVAQALVATSGTWGLTALGAGVVFFFRTVERKVLDSMLGFASGVMIAASFWALLAPAIAMAEEFGVVPWLPAVVGFVAGGADLPQVTLGSAVALAIGIGLQNLPEGTAAAQRVRDGPPVRPAAPHTSSSSAQGSRASSSEVSTIQCSSSPA